MALQQTGVTNPRGRGKEKRVQALRWLNRWGYSTPSVLGELCGLERTAGSRLVQQLLERDLVREVAAGGNWGYWKYMADKESGKRQRHGPFVTMLTEVGKSTAIQLDGMGGAPWERQVSGVQSIRHNLMTQRFAVHMLNRLGYADYLPEAMSRTESSLGNKQPDVVMLDRNQNRVAIEIELTPKSNTTGALDRALRAVQLGLKLRHFEQVVYVFGSDYPRSQYERAWQSGRIQAWEKAGSKWLPADGYYEIEPRHLGAVAFIQSNILLADIS